MNNIMYKLCLKYTRKYTILVGIILFAMVLINKIELPTETIPFAIHSYSRSYLYHHD